MKHAAYHVMLFVVLAALLSGATSVQAAVWVGGTGNWASDNWGLNAPDGYPGDANHSGVAADIEGGVVTLDANLPNPTGDLRLRTGTSTLNISADLTTANFYVGDGANSVSTVNQTAGIVTVPTTGDGLGLMRFGSTAANVATYNLSGGELKITARNLTFGRDNSTDTRRGTAVFSMSGTSKLTIDRDLKLFAENSRMLINASQGVTIDVQGNALTPYQGITLSSPRVSQAAYSFDTLLEVTGYNAATSLKTKNMHIYQGEFAQGTSGTAQSVVRFVLGANGVNPWDVSGILDLGTGIYKGELEVVPFGLAPGSITLFNYATLNNGAFGDVRIAGRSTAYTDPFTGLGDLSMGEYYLDYGDGSNDSIILYFGEGLVIPEPATMALIVFGVLGLYGMRKRGVRSV